MFASGFTGPWIINEIINPCHAEEIKMPCPLLISSQSDYLIQIFDRKSLGGGGGGGW